MINDKKTKKEEKKTEKNEIELLKKEKELLKTELEEFRNKYLRALADYQNLEKRVNSEMRNFQKKANRQLILKFLEVLDLIEKAEVFVKDHGLKLIKEKFLQILKEEQVTEIDILGKHFDPNLAECIEVINGLRDNMVVEVVRKGYRLGDEVIRVARVKVEKNVKS